MSLTRSFNRILNKVSFHFSKRIYFIYDWKIKSYVQEAIVEEQISIRAYTLNDYSKAVLPDSKSAQDLAKFLELDRKSKKDRIKTILAFYHSIPYTRDQKFPSGDDAKTLYGGLRTCELDCEDSAIGIVTLLIKYGMHAHMVYIERPKGSNKTSHCVAGLSEDDLDNPSGSHITNKGKDYYLIEGTAERKIGDIGAKYAGWRMYIMDCSQRWLE